MLRDLFFKMSVNAKFPTLRSISKIPSKPALHKISGVEMYRINFGSIKPTDSWLLFNEDK